MHQASLAPRARPCSYRFPTMMGARNAWLTCSQPHCSRNQIAPYSFVSLRGTPILLPGLPARDNRMSIVSSSLDRCPTRTGAILLPAHVRYFDLASALSLAPASAGAFFCPFAAPGPVRASSRLLHGWHVRPPIADRLVKPYMTSVGSANDPKPPPFGSYATGWIDEYLLLPRSKIHGVRRFLLPRRAPPLLASRHQAFAARSEGLFSCFSCLTAPLLSHALPCMAGLPNAGLPCLGA